jgi:hypothetical protein
MAKTKDNMILFKCTACDFEERIPIEAVYFFDIFDPNDIDSPPCIGCEVCSGTMIPANSSCNI